MKPKLGLALGGGAAKGWAHIGVLRALQSLGLEPDIVAGTSIGSLVGAAYVTGNLDDLEQWVSGLSWADVIALLDIRLSGGGLIKGDRVLNRLRARLEGIRIERLARPFAAVATDLDLGNEFWLRDGPIIDAVRASIALPGLFTPIKLKNRWLVDGGLVNPVPVSLCRALGADIVIAVDLTLPVIIRQLGGAPFDGFDVKVREGEAVAARDRMLQMFQGMLGKFREKTSDEDPLPSILDVATRSIQIMTARIARSRLAGEPAELLLTPKVADIALMEFHRAREAIELGHAEAMRFKAELEQIRQMVSRDAKGSAD